MELVDKVLFFFGIGNHGLVSLVRIEEFFVWLVGFCSSINSPNPICMQTHHCHGWGQWLLYHLQMWGVLQETLQRCITERRAGRITLFEKYSRHMDINWLLLVNQTSARKHCCFWCQEASRTQAFACWSLMLMIGTFALIRCKGIISVNKNMST